MKKSLSNQFYWSACIAFIAGLILSQFFLDIRCKIFGCGVQLFAIYILMKICWVKVKSGNAYLNWYITSMVCLMVTLSQLLMLVADSATNAIIFSILITLLTCSRLLSKTLQMGSDSHQN